MKKTLPVILILIFSAVLNVSGQILCIYCYEQNDSISHNVSNMVLNGSFETTNCQPNDFSNSFCPASSYYGCTVNDWICTGGGIDSYVSIDDNTFTQTADGIYAAYLGNGVSGAVCSNIQYDTTCFVMSGCELTNVPQGYPTTEPDLGGSNGVSIEQTVSGLTVGSTYVLEFWAGGEPQAHGWQLPGVFGLDIGFGYNFLRCKPTCPTCIGTTYIIVFNATSTSHTLKFTNWGHVCIPCTEVILDNVRVYPYAQINPNVPPCAGTNVSAMFTAPNDICPGTCTDFTNLSSNATSYTWNFPGANPPVSTDVNPTNICYNTPGSYDVTLIASGASGSDTLLLPNYITVYPTPPPQGILQSGDTLIANAGAVSYQWFHNGNLIPGATAYFYVATAGGNYNVVATDVNGCEVEAVIFDVIASITDHQITGLSIYPSPVQNTIVVSGSFSRVKQVSLEVYNMVGEILQSATLETGNTGKLRSELNVGELAGGIYLLKISSDGKHAFHKFIKSDLQ